MSSAIDTTVDFRRKLLRFDRPIYAQYRKSNIPRFYASFIPNWRSYYVGPGECNSKPEKYHIEFPFRNIELDKCASVRYNKNIITPKLFSLKWLVIGLLFSILCISQKKMFVFTLIVLAYLFSPIMEFFGTRPVLQRGDHFNYPSWSR